MAAVEKSNQDALCQRQGAFLYLILVVAFVIFGGGYVSTANAHALGDLPQAAGLILASTQDSNCPCRGCDQDADACCVSACFSPIGAVAFAVSAPTVDRHSAANFHYNASIPGAAPSSLFRPPKLLVQA